jgi:hypothetical protein
MKTQTKSTSTKIAYGETLKTAIPYSYSWNAFETIDEVKAADKMMSDEDIIKFRNNEKLAAARSAALTEALKAAGYEKPTLETDDQLKLREMVKVLRAVKNKNGEAKFTEAQAKDIASNTLGLEWATE